MNAVSTEVGGVELDRKELFQLCAIDSIFYSKYFFPKTFRQASPWFHRDFWNKFENPDYDYFAAEMFRGSGKTTLTRVGISKRIAFGLSRNILSVAISQEMSIHTVTWIRKQVENNTRWTQMFGLHKGKKWTDDWITIYNEPFDCEINVVAKGMTSGLRGLNLDDWRPDFIQCDDICNEENTATEEQRNKTNDLIFGALAPSLAPKSEAPTRKFALLQTGLNKDDAINKAHADPAFLTVKYPKVVENENGALVSTWPERFPTDECIREKEDYIRRGQIHIWLREYGCKIVSRETSPLNPDYLRVYKTLPTKLLNYTYLDPAISKKKHAHRTAGATIGVDPNTGNVYIRSYKSQKGETPDEMWAWVCGEYRTQRPRNVGVETIAFQKFLAWYFEKKMQEERFYFPLKHVADKRPKADRIIQAFSGLLAQGKLWIDENMTDLRAMVAEWTENQDFDLLDAIAGAIALANPWMIIGENQDAEEGEDPVLDESDIPELSFSGGAP